MFCRASVAGTAVLLLFLACPLLAGQVYQWTDAEGTTHFTDDLTQVPSSKRDSAEVLTLPEGPPPRPSSPEEEKDAEETPALDSRTELEEMLVDPIAACQGAVRGEAMKLKKQMDADAKRLEELNREIHRTAISREKNELQRERVALKKRLEEARARLEGDLVVRARDCQMEPDW